ncbi:ATP-binding protein [Marinomonas sp. THO17]|uniref:ATP-binding protein n=1 Tax=Marinomonas sp. THO17 TaxID=3149048 RepID=UPI00336BD93A
MKHSRYSLDDKQVREMCLKDLAKRSRFGGVFYLMAFLATVFSSTVVHVHLEFIALFSILFIVLQIERLRLYHKAMKPSEVDLHSLFSRYSLLYNTSAFIWVASSVWLFYMSPVIDIGVMVNVMSSAAISMGGMAVLVVSHKMQRTYWLIICLPFAFAAAVLLEPPTNWIIVILTLGYGVFILMIGKQLNRSYWQTLNDNLMLSEQAKELEKAKLQAEAAGQAKANFLAAMTHEIRTPLNGILGMAQLLSLSKLNDEQRQHVSVINNAGSNLMHIINNILDYSKMNAAELELEQKKFDPKALVEEVVYLLSSQADRQGLQLSCDFDDVPGTVFGDSYRLHQILYNLIGNAIKFTEQGWVKVSVSSQALTASNEPMIQLILQVEDTGIGISKANIEHIFEQFYQINQFHSNIRGTGLGLSITKRIVDLMGGDIQVHSEVGKGTRFSVILPFNLAMTSNKTTKEVLQDKDKQPKPVDQQTAFTEPSSLQVLLVEDNRINQIVGEQFLIRLGCQVDIAENGIVAQDKFLHRDDYDVIFMDCNMPEMDGFDATRAIRQIEQRENRKATPIVALTAHVEDAIKRQCLEAGMDAFMSKPFLLVELEAIVEGIKLGKPLQL